MSDGPRKPAIPAWQHAQTPLKPDIPSTMPRGESAEPTSTPAATTSLEQDETSAVGIEASGEPTTDQERVKSFLQHDEIRAAPIEKKRTFLLSKDIPAHVIDQKLGATVAAFDASDVASFQTKSTTTPLQAQTRPAAPPIITYPEWLAESHKPPPLITVSRAVNTAYIASGLAALLYGASTFLMQPMAERMTESRHDLAAHSTTKVDKFNDRLSKLVSRVPETKRAGDDADDIESITSDPTELFHRDMGTQTSPPLSPSSSTSTETGAHPAITKQADRLASLNSELASILSGSESADAATKVRQEKLDELHNYLDNTLYRSQPVSVWSSGVDANEEKGRWDAVEELKKEIRGVKGVLLSAKRFAPVNGVRAG
ncbi:hypothetical protein B0A48_05825 [Cryoendolithus antarcticus]|uniref:Peroxisome membrane anchor protein Pex14p N-terminal domain-containing protein n=1 Tax=Cryoendolithus antarcticus TaxID=1507870 RepID=A0A1V8TC33_9PEZI|nr:hypothetical protein B0A48_05825 [Cryoendolithus antarcticus]